MSAESRRLRSASEEAQKADAERGERKTADVLIAAERRGEHAIDESAEPREQKAE